MVKRGSSMLPCTMVIENLCISCLSLIILSMLLCGYHARGIQLHKLENTVKSYEHIFLTIQNNPSSTRDGKIKPAVDTWYITFNAFGKFFELMVHVCQECNALLAPNIKVSMYLSTGVEELKHASLGVKIVKGTVLGVKDSYVKGTLFNQMFTGEITMNKEALYIELLGSETIIYRESNVTEFEHPSCNHSDHSSNSKLHHHKKTFWKRHTSTRHSNNTTQHRQKRNFQKRESYSPRYVCTVKLYADHTFYLYNTDRTGNVTVARMVRVMDGMNDVFRKTDLDYDTYEGELQFEINAVQIFVDQNAINYPLNDEGLTSSEALDRFSIINNEDYCLAIMFTYRRFKDKQLGWVYPYKHDPLIRGGICDTRNNPFHRTYVERDFNTMIITFLGLEGNQLTHLLNVQNLGHHIGHSFGAPHDDNLDKRCHPKGVSYMMAGKISATMSENIPRFSSCSKVIMYGVILDNEKCLIITNRESICGNGVTEENEECDCGDESQCSIVDNCCNPKTFRGMYKGCTLKRQIGAVCSARESFCCTSKCQIVTAYARKDCTRGNDCMKSSICQGNTASCPFPELKENRTPCKNGYGKCVDGTCINTLCNKYSMEPCDCPETENECKVCCQKAGLSSCRPLRKWGIIVKNESLLRRPDGELCLEERGRCLKGLCNLFMISVTELQLRKTEEQLNAPSYMIVLVGLVISLILVFFVLVIIWICNKGILIRRSR